MSQSIPSALVGQGIDIFSTYRLDDALLPDVLDAAAAPKHTFQFLGTDYSVPSYLQGIETASSKVAEASVDDRDGYQNSLADQAEVDRDIGAFAAQMSLAYGSQFAATGNDSYAYRNIYISLGVLQVSVGDAIPWRSQEFVNAVNALPQSPDPNDLRPFSGFFERYGFSYSSVVNLGGVLELSVAVSKSSGLSAPDIAKALHTEFVGLFASGSLPPNPDPNWQKYLDNRHVRINMLGGDPQAIAWVTRFAGGPPSADSVAAYNSWVDSVASAPAATDFKVRPIWDLAPERSAALEQAFAMLRDGLRPAMSVECSGQPGMVPTIVLRDPLVPTQPPAFQSGFQVVVLDGEVVSPAGVVFNRYYSIDGPPNDYRPYGELWEQMVRDLQQSGFDTPKYFLVLATFNWGLNAPPVEQPPEFTAYDFLRSCGGGETLRDWISHADPGSNVPASIVSYLLVGRMAGGPCLGVEGYMDGAAQPARQQVFFYREPGSNGHSLGA